MDTMSIILVGCGNMGRAMLEGWLSSGQAVPEHVVLIEPVEALRAAASVLGVNAIADVADLDRDIEPELIIFAVKPQALADVVPVFARFKRSCTYVSIAAGTPIAAFKRMLGEEAAVVRCMPNTPAAIGKGMIVAVADERVAPAAWQRLASLLSASGKVTAIDDERLMDAVTAVSGSGPAYVFHFIESLQAAACAVGLSQETAKLLAIQTVFGAAALAAESADEPGELRRKVTSPNGTTAAALEVLMTEDGMSQLVEKAVQAAHRRSVELRQQDT